MTLSEIVAFCNELQKINIAEQSGQTARDLAAVVYSVTNSAVKSQDLAEQLQAKHQEIKTNLHEFEQILITLRQNLVKVIAANDQRCIDTDMARYPKETSLDDLLHLKLNIGVQITAECHHSLDIRTRTLSDWRFPGMVFRPTCDEWMQSTVALDPLYVVDHYEHLLIPFVSQFNELYQRRLRKYLINDPGVTGALDKLPNNQFGYVLAYNFFNYKPLPVLERYLQEIWHKLRPGGVFIMTFNDCDIAHNMRLNERTFMCYQPWRLLEPMVLQAGYEVVSVNHQGGDMTWCELRRPGQLNSIRGAQTQARVVAL